MNKNISHLHYITQDITGVSHQELMMQVCKAGADWVQLRIKNKPYGELLEIGLQASRICAEHQAKLIINDSVAVAMAVNADGVHLGKTDMDPREARQILGAQSIIGGTANTFDDIEKLVEAGVDYIGLGPYRFTSTKKNLSPILGLEGYRKILAQCREKEITIPVIAIGGIKQEDVKLLMNEGLYGIAVSSAINLAPVISAAVRYFKNEFETKNIETNEKIKAGR
jgi:thiamine-phosphate pyrophosphorylase